MLNKNIDVFIRIINTINAFFVILLIAFPQQIINFLGFELQPIGMNHVLLFTTFVLFFFLAVYSKYYRMKRLNIDMTKQATKIAERVTVGILFFIPILISYFYYLEKNYGQYIDSNFGNVLLLIPFGMTVSAAVSQSAYIIERKSNVRKIILLLSTVLLFSFSTVQKFILAGNTQLSVVQVVSFLYFGLLFVLSNVRQIKKM